MLRLVYLALMLLVPVQALAMPPVVIAAIAYYAGTITFLQLVVTVAMTVYGMEQQRKAKRAAARAKREYNDSLQDKTVTQIATEAPYRYVYGRARVGSNVVALFTTGDKDQYKWLVCVHANHECAAIEELYINSKALGALDASGYVTGGDYYSETTEKTYQVFNSNNGGGATTVTLLGAPIGGDVILSGDINRTYDEDSSWDYTLNGATLTVMFPVGDRSRPFRVTYKYVAKHPKVRIIKHLGTPGQTADQTLISASGGKWNSQCTLDDMCYSVVWLDLTESSFQGGMPSIEALIKGKKVLDPRTNTTAWSENPALCLYDYLRGEMCNISANDIPLGSVITAANVCDEPVLSISGYSPLQPRYTLNGAVLSDEAAPDVIDEMVKAMAGGIVACTWEMYAGKYIAPVAELSQEDIVGGCSIVAGASDSDLYNGIKGQYIDPANLYVSTDFKAYQNTTYLAADGRELWNNINFPFTNNLQRVQNICRIFVEDQREGQTLSIDFNLKAWRLKVGQRIQFTSKFFGWDKKVFRVIGKKYSPDSSVNLTLKEDGAGVWDFADAVVVDSIPNTNLPNPFKIDKISGVTCESGTNTLLRMSDGTIVSRVLVKWDAVKGNADTVEVEWLDNDFIDGEMVWSKTTQQATAVSAYISPVQDKAAYTIRVRAANAYLGVKSDWTYVEHTVIGKSAPPTDVPWFFIDGDVLTWGVIEDVDLRGYVVRYHYGDNTSWDDANAIHDGILTETPYTLKYRPQGNITLMIKAIDTTGNFSGTPAIIKTALGDIAVQNVIEEIDLQALGYPGLVEGANKIDGKLIAPVVSLFYGGDTSRFYGQYESLSFFNDTYSAVVYTTSELLLGEDLVGANLSLLMDIAGNGINIKYKVYGYLPMYGDVDSEPFFSDDTETFYDMGQWLPWRGNTIAKNAYYVFQFSIAMSELQGIINTCKLVIDVPDIVERLNDVVVPAEGLRLTLKNQYRVIKNIQITLQDDGGNAVKAEIGDKLSSAPLVRCRDSSQQLTSGTVDIVVQGY